MTRKVTKRGYARVLTAVALAAPLALGLASAASADWLVLRDGSRVETLGPWQERSGLVVFHLPGGTLSSLPKREVDLDSSVRATADERQAQPAPETTEGKAAPRPIVVLTDADVAHVEPTDAAPGAATEEGEAAAESTGSAELQISGWDWTTKASPPGIEITGTLRNSSQDVASSLALRVILLADDGGLVGRANASLVRSALQPGQATSFTAFFPGVYDFNTPRFETQSSMIARRPAPQADE
jgi:hypothetical protein